MKRFRKYQKVKTHTFNGRKYNIYIFPDGFDGVCDQYTPEVDEREVIIAVDPTTRNGLITIIHECLHAENWRASEESVDRTSTEIGTFLWRCGFRIK